MLSLVTIKYSLKKAAFKSLKNIRNNTKVTAKQNIAATNKSLKKLRPDKDEPIKKKDKKSAEYKSNF